MKKTTKVRLLLGALLFLSIISSIIFCNGLVKSLKGNFIEQNCNAVLTNAEGISGDTTISYSTITGENIQGPMLDFSKSTGSKNMTVQETCSVSVSNPRTVIIKLIGSVVSVSLGVTFLVHFVLSFFIRFTKKEQQT